MCVVALTASIASCNIKFIDDLSAIDMNVTLSSSWLLRYTSKEVLESVCTT